VFYGLWFSLEQRETMLVNHGNIYVVNESSLIRSLDGNVPVQSDFLVDMSSLEDITLIVNSLQDLQ